MVARNSDFARLAASAAASFCLSELMSRTMASSPSARPSSSCNGVVTTDTTTRSPDRVLAWVSNDAGSELASGPSSLPEIELTQRPADRLGRVVAVQARGAPIPRGDDAVLVVGEDGVARLFDLRDEQAVSLLALVQRAQQRLDVLGHAVEGPANLRGLRRADQGCPYGVVTLPEAAGARRQLAKRLHRAAQCDERDAERHSGAQEQDAEALDESMPQLVHEDRGIDLKVDGPVPLAAHDDGLRLLQEREADPADKPLRRFWPDGGSDRRDRMAGVVRPGEPGDERLPRPGPQELLDDRIVADYRGPAHRGDGESHLLVEPLAQREPAIGDLALENEVQEPDGAAHQGQAGAEHEASREREPVSPQPAERKRHYWSSTFTSAVR